MLASLSRWVREEAPSRLVPTRLRRPMEAWTAAHAYPDSPGTLRWTLSPDSGRAALLLGGDLALHKWRPGDTPDSVVSGLGALARTADALILNLETQLTPRQNPPGTIGTALKADPSRLSRPRGGFPHRAPCA